MAASYNKVMLMGNLTRDPELRYTPSGQGVATFTIAVNRTYNSSSGEKKEDVSFVRIVAWARQAEICNEYLKKGSPIFVEGRLQSRNWEAQDGSKRSTMEVVAQNVQFLSSRSKGDTPQEPQMEEAIIDDAGAMPGGSPKSGANANDDIPF